MSLFSNRQESKQEASLRSGIRTVENALVSLGHPPDESRAESDDDMPAWRIDCGHGVKIDVRLVVDGEQSFLRVSATIAAVPRSDAGNLYRRLLELNASVIKGVAFGVFHGDIVLVNAYGATTLDLSNVRQLLQQTEKLALHYASIFSSGTFAQ